MLGLTSYLRRLLTITPTKNAAAKAGSGTWRVQRLRVSSDMPGSRAASIAWLTRSTRPDRNGNTHGRGSNLGRRWTIYPVANPSVRDARVAVPRPIHAREVQRVGATF
jgi:hypothetical protein